MKKGDKVDTGATFCPVCGRGLGLRGRYNHYMAHVRKGEMTVENDPVTSEMIRLGVLTTAAQWYRLPPYIFRLAVGLEDTQA